MGVDKYKLRNSNLDRLGRPNGDKDELELALLLRGQRETEVAEGIKGHRDLLAVGTHKRRLEQPVKLVYDDRVVTFHINVPRLFGRLLQAHSVNSSHTRRSLESER